MKRTLTNKDLEDIKYFFNKYYTDNQDININDFLREVLEIIIDKYNFKQNLSKIKIINKKTESDGIYDQEENSIYLNKIMLLSNQTELKRFFQEEGVSISKESHKYLAYLLCVETIIHELEHKNQAENMQKLKTEYSEEEIELLIYNYPITNTQLYINEFQRKTNPTKKQIKKELKRLEKVFDEIYEDLYDYDPIERQAFTIATEYSNKLVDNQFVPTKLAELYFLRCKMNNQLNGYQPIKNFSESFSPTEAHLILQDKEILIPKITLLQKEELSLEERIFIGAKITKEEFNEKTNIYKEKIKILK